MELSAQWKAVLTWGIDHGVVADLLPMSKETLTALTQEILMVGCATGTIKNLWSSIEDRNLRFGLFMPLRAWPSSSGCSKRSKGLRHASYFL